MRKLFVVFAFLSIIVLPFTAKSQGSTNPDVVPGYNFKVVFNKQVLFFQEVTGMPIPPPRVPTSSGYNTPPRKLPGIVKYSPATFKKGVLKNGSINKDWINPSESSFRGTMEVYALDDAGNTLAHWSLLNAWVTKITVPDIKSADVAIETLVVSITGVTFY